MERGRKRRTRLTETTGESWEDEMAWLQAAAKAGGSRRMAERSTG